MTRTSRFRSLSLSSLALVWPLAACDSNTDDAGGSGASTSTVGPTTGKSSTTSDASAATSASTRMIDPGEPCSPGSPLAPVVAAMEPGSWKALAGTDMQQVCPAPGYACNAVMIAWSGAAFDTLHDRLIVFGGGHADSPYNNVFVFDLPQMKWIRLTELPWTGEVPARFSDQRVENCGLYPHDTPLAIPVDWMREPSVAEGCVGKRPGDACTVFALGQENDSTCVDDGAGNPYCNVGYVRGEMCDDPALVAQLDPQQPRSTHTYGNIAFSPSDGRFYILGSVGMWKTGQTGSARVSAFDFTTGTWARRADNPHTDYGTSATDADGNIWYLSGSSVARYAPATDTWSDVTSETHGHYYGGAAVDTTRKVLGVTGDGVTVHTYAIGEAGAPYTERATSGLDAALAQAPGFEYDAKLDRYVAWSGGRAVRYLDPTTWQWASVEGTGDDPGTQAQNGTFGRFRYSPSCNVYVTVASAETDVFVFKPPQAAP